MGKQSEENRPNMTPEFKKHKTISLEYTLVYDISNTLDNIEEDAMLC